MSAVNMFMRRRESVGPGPGPTEGQQVTLQLQQSDLETLRGVLEIFRSEWNMNLSKGILQDDLTGIATAEAVLRKIDPLLKIIG